MKNYFRLAFIGGALLLASPVQAQIGRRFPSERKVVKDPVTGTMLTFLTRRASKSVGQRG